MKKPKMITDEQIEYHWTLPEGMSSTHYGVLKAVAQKALDECWKEMLRQFREWLELEFNLDGETGHWYVFNYEQQVRTLQAQLEEAQKK